MTYSDEQAAILGWYTATPATRLAAEERLRAAARKILRTPPLPVLPPPPGARHHHVDPFPERCDHCPAPLTAGTRYRRVMLVMDGSDSFAGGMRATVENSYELVLCFSCNERLTRWLLCPLTEVAAEGEVVDELDDEELAAELAKEMFILEKDPEVRGGTSREARKPESPEGSRQVAADSSGRRYVLPAETPILPRKKNPFCTAPECPVHTLRVPGRCTANPGLERLDNATVIWKPLRSLPSPENMLGAGDQFPGSDDPFDDVDPGPWKQT